MTWTRILEKKPANFKQILIFDDVNEYVIGYYHEAGGVFIGSVDAALIKNARFWMHLPELPVNDEDTQ